MGTRQSSDRQVGTLALGTASWTFPDWQGVFYPEGLPASERLAFYATQFNSVEVNTSFYGLPAPSTLIQWVESVPEGFTFALKAPRLITHEQRLQSCEQPVRAYLDVLRSLGPAAAPGFFQFPPNFTRQREGRTLAHFLDWLAGELDGVAIAVEVRATDLMTPAFARFLAERGMSLVVVERTGTPDFYAAWQEQWSLPSAPKVLYLRLIGNDRDKLPNDRSIQRPQDALLDKWATRIMEALDANIQVYCYIHNPFEGHSPATVRRLRERIEQRHPLPPWAPPMVKRSPPQDDEETGQLSLFG